MKGTMIAALAAGLLAGNLTAAESSGLTTSKQKASYAIGVNFGRNLAQGKQQGLDLDVESLVKGLKDALDGKPAMNDEELKAAMTALQQEMKGKAAQVGEKAKADGVAFLAGNKSKEGVKSTATGLQYKVLREGKGAKPKASDTVKVHYRGTLLDGTEFDSSYKRNEPIEFPLDGVIKGWTEGLQLMAVGSKYQFWIPSELAYGEGGSQGTIPPNATLMFEVELLDLPKAEAAK